MDFDVLNAKTASNVKISKNGTETAKRHEGCPNCYLIKKHGIMIEENVAKTLKNSINRKAWKNMIKNKIDRNTKETNAVKMERDDKTDQGPPSQGTTEPPFGEGLRAPTPKAEKITNTKNEKNPKNWRCKRREGRQCKKLTNERWETALQTPKKLSKRQDNNANKKHREKILKSRRRTTRNPSNQTGEFGRIAHLLVRKEKRKREK